MLAGAVAIGLLAAVVAVFALGRGGDGPEPAGSSTPAPAPAAAPAPAPAAGQRATVVGVADAVTLDVRLPDGATVVRVRALGVADPGSCYSAQATAFARRVLGNQAVDLIAETPGSPDLAARARADPTTDRFDRRLQQVVLDGGRDYAVLATEAGIARSYAPGADPWAMPPVRAAEARAKTAERGLWGPPCSGRAETSDN